MIIFLECDVTHVIQGLSFCVVESYNVLNFSYYLGDFIMINPDITFSFPNTELELGWYETYSSAAEYTRLMCRGELCYSYNCSSRSAWKVNWLRLLWYCYCDQSLMHKVTHIFVRIEGICMFQETEKLKGYMHGLLHTIKTI